MGVRGKKHPPNADAITRNMYQKLPEKWVRASSETAQVTQEHSAEKTSLGTLIRTDPFYFLGLTCFTKHIWGITCNLHCVNQNQDSKALNDFGARGGISFVSRYSLHKMVVREVMTANGAQLLLLVQREAQGQKLICITVSMRRTPKLLSALDADNVREESGWCNPGDGRNMERLFSITGSLSLLLPPWLWLERRLQKVWFWIIFLYVDWQAVEWKAASIWEKSPESQHEHRQIWETVLYCILK